jgi:hypothetical protein
MELRNVVPRETAVLEVARRISDRFGVIAVSPVEVVIEAPTHEAASAAQEALDATLTGMMEHSGVAAFELPSQLLFGHVSGDEARSLQEATALVAAARTRYLKTLSNAGFREDEAFGRYRDILETVLTIDDSPGVWPQLRTRVPRLSSTVFEYRRK